MNNYYSRSYWTLEEVEKEVEAFACWKKKQWFLRIRFALEYAVLACLIFTGIAWGVCFFWGQVNHHILAMVAGISFMLFAMYGLVDFFWMIGIRNRQLKHLLVRTEAGEQVEKSTFPVVFSK